MVSHLVFKCCKVKQKKKTRDLLTAFGSSSSSPSPHMDTSKVPIVSSLIIVISFFSVQPKYNKYYVVFNHCLVLIILCSLFGFHYVVVVPRSC